MTLQRATINKLGKLFPRLTSDHDGEVVATARAIIRTLETAGSSIYNLSEAMTPKTVERVVYKEKIVYRDRPAPAPEPVTEAACEYIDIPDKDMIVRFADVLLNDCDLSANEEKFVRHMRQLASRRPKMRMSVRQKGWWDLIIEDYDVSEKDLA